jgi:hypothetical protein
MILDTSDSQRGYVMLPRDPADVVPNALFDLLVNEITPLFGTKNDVVKQLGV